MMSGMDDNPDRQPADPVHDEPGNPFSALMMGALAMHEYYTSLIAGGFNAAEALYLVASVATGGPKGPA